MIAGAAPRFEWKPNPDGATQDDSGGVRDREALGRRDSRLRTILDRRIRLPGREYDGQDHDVPGV